MPLIGTLTSGSLGAFGLAQQAQIAILKATTAISGSSFEFQQIVNSPAGSSLAGTNTSILGTGSFAAHGDYLVTGDGTYQNVYVWNLSDGSLHMSVPMPSPPPQTNGWGFQIDIHGDYFIAGNGGDSLDSGRVTIHNVSTGALIKTLYGNARYVGISENYAVSISSSGNIHIFELATNTLRTFGHPNTGSGSKLIEVHGNNLILGFSDGSLVSVHDIPTAFANANLNTSSLTINPGRSFRSLEAEGNYLALGGGGTADAQRILIYDLTTGTLLHDLDPPEGIGDYIYPGLGNSVQISGDYLVAGYGRGAKGPVAVYDLTTGTLLQSFTIDDLPDTYSFDNEGNFGSSVAITDSKTIVGIRYHKAVGWESGDGQGAFIIYSNPGQVAAPAVSADWSNVTLAHTLDNPNTVGTSDHHYFSHAAISNTYAIVGAPNANGDARGNAYIFDVSDGSLVYTLDNPSQGSIPSDWFGAATAISDTHAIVGNYVFDDGTGGGSGVAYIYDLSDGSIAHTLNNPNAYTYPNGYNNDYFGERVGIAGDYVIVGASREDDNTGGDSGNTGNNSGKAYIFKVSDGSLVYTFNNPNVYGTGSNDFFGGTVEISSTHAIVGARTEDGASADAQGAAYIYDLSDGSLAYTLTNPNSYGTGDRDYFGGAVAISSTHAIVGAWNEDSAPGVNTSWGDEAGVAYIYDLSDGSLAYTLTNPNSYDTSAGDHFGWAVAMNDTHAIVSAFIEDDADGDNSGAAYIYDLSDGSLVSTLSNPNAYGTSADDRFGAYVGISDNRVIVGAYWEDDANGENSGKAYIFNAAEKAAEAAPASAGWSVDLSNITYDNVSYTIADNLDNTPYQIVFNDDGTKMYVLGGNNARVLEYPLSTAFDLSTISALSGLFTVSSQETGPTSLAFNTDGTKMYILGYGSANIHQYTLSTAFQVTASSVSYDNVSFSVSNQELYPMNLVFNTDGTKMYVNGFNNTIYEYALTTAFDVSSASFNNASFSGATEATGLYGFRFNQDGTKMYWISNQSDAVYQYSLATAFDVSTTSYDNVSYSILSEDGETLDLVFSNDGTKMYISGNSADTVYQYSTGL